MNDNNYLFITISEFIFVDEDEGELAELLGEEYDAKFSKNHDDIAELLGENDDQNSDNGDDDIEFYEEGLVSILSFCIQIIEIFFYLF